MSILAKNISLSILHTRVIDQTYKMAYAKALKTKVYRTLFLVEYRLKYIASKRQIQTKAIETRERKVQERVGSSVLLNRG